MESVWKCWKFYVIILAAELHFVLTSGKNIPDSCEVITVKFCKNMPYNYTKLPNSLNHNNQDNIDKILSHFDPLVQLGCSKYLEKFLCSLYVPFCTELDTFILPCRDLCMDAKTKCISVMKQYKYSWPKILDCENFPEKDICIPLETDYNDTGFDSTELLYTYTAVDSKEVAVDTSFNERIILLLATYNQILLYDVAPQDLIPIYKGLEQGTGAGIDFHFKKELLFWAEKGDGRMFRATLTLDEARDLTIIIDVGPSIIESIAVDWVTDHLFWLESYPATLKVAKLDGTDPTVLYKFPDENKNPKFLVIDPFSGYLFWIQSEGDLYAPGACIERYDLRSKQIFTVYNITDDDLHNMGRPKGLALDMKQRRIYWTDARSESLQYVGYNGKKFKIVVTNQEFLGEPLCLSRYKNNLFWSDLNAKSIGKISVTNGQKPTFIESLPGSPATDLKVFHQDVQQKGKAPYTIQLLKSSTTNKSSSKHYQNLYIEFVMISLTILFSLRNFIGV